MQLGYEWVHSIIDDHSRCAYSELHPDERADTVTAFVERAPMHLAEHGIEPKRLLSDNAFVYRHNRTLRELLQAHRIKHRVIRPRRAQTNGKVERYQQTLKRESGPQPRLPLQRAPRRRKVIGRGTAPRWAATRP